MNDTLDSDSDFSEYPPTFSQYRADSRTVPISFAVIVVSLLLAFSVWTRALWKMLIALAWVGIIEYTPVYWVKERIPLSSQRFTEIERAAMWTIHEKQQAAHRKAMKRSHERKSAKDQKKWESERRSISKAKRNKEGSWRAAANGRASGVQAEPDETIEVFGKDGDVHMV